MKKIALVIGIGAKVEGAIAGFKKVSNSVTKVESTIKKLKSNRLEILTNDKKVKKLGNAIESIETKVKSLRKQKLDLQAKLSTAKSQKEIDELNKKIAKTSRKITSLNANKIKLKEQFKKTRDEAEKTNKSIQKIDSTIKKLNSTKLKIKQTVQRREIIKQEFIGNVAKVTAMGVALGSVALGIGRINKETTQMANLADTVGLSFSAVSTLGTAVKGIGLNYEHVTDIMEELNNKIGESKVKYKEWLKEDKGKGKELKLVGGVDDAFKGLDFSLSDKSFKNLNYEETFKKFTKMNGDKQFEIVMDTALKMKDGQKAASMVDILMGGEANKILSFLKKQGKSYKEFMRDQQKLNFLNKEGLNGAKEYSKVSAKTSSIVSSMFQQIAGVGGSFMTPILKDFNTWIVLNKELIQQNIKGFFEGIKSAIGTVGTAIERVKTFLEPVLGLFVDVKEKSDAMGESGSNFGKVLTYMATGFTALIGAKVILGGIGLAVGVVSQAFRVLRLVTLANPVVLVATAIAGVATLIYTNWGSISEFFSGIWTSIKSGVDTAWNGLKTAFAWSPLGLIVNNFSKVTDFFSNFSLKDAGAKIITSVVDGFNSKIEYLKGKVASITQTIRDYWPFSPARRGALRDIHKIKLLETVASGLNEKPLLSAVNNTTTKLRKSLAVGGVVALSTSLAATTPIATNNQSSLLSNLPNQTISSSSKSATSPNININFNGGINVNATDGKIDTTAFQKQIQQAINEALDNRTNNDNRMYD